MKKIKIYLPSVIFNLIEFFLIFLLGILSKVSIEEITFLCILFATVRTSCENPMHYKSPILCLIWSSIVFESFFLLTKVNMPIAMILTAFEAMILTKQGDIRNIFMYRNDENSKYREMKKYIKDKKDSAAINHFEDILKKLDKKYKERYKSSFYLVYQLYFKEEKSFNEIIKETSLYDNHAITRILDIIFISFNTYITMYENLDELQYNEELTSN